jgi:predicted nucleotidyltransferase
MDENTKPVLMRWLREAGVDVEGVTAHGGGIWCFGSQASDCARADSDWDILVVTRAPVLEPRIRHARLDLVNVQFNELDAWTSTELAAHVAAHGVRIDHGRKLTLRSIPTAAAPRKCAVVSKRAQALDALWGGLQPEQRRREMLRLRRDLHRAWLLTQGAAIPPTAVLEHEWRSSPLRARVAILNFIPLPQKIARVIAQPDDQGSICPSR